MNLDTIFTDFPKFEPGQVWLAGAGPGRLGMLTLECLHALQSADCIIYDALVNEKILQWANQDAELIFAGKRGGKCSPKQEDITQTLIAKAKIGKKLLRLKGGDPFTFARGGEEALKLANENIPFRILPGITSGIGGLAAAAIPLTQRESNVNVMLLTGHAFTGNIPDNFQWQAIAQGADVMVWYMAHKYFPQIADHLMRAGRKVDESVAFISHASRPEQKVTICKLNQASIICPEIETPTIIVIGPIVDLHPILMQSFLSG